MKFDSYIAEFILGADYCLSLEDALSDPKQIKFRPGNNKPIKDDVSKWLFEKYGTIDFQCLDSSVFELGIDDLKNKNKVQQACRELNSINNGIKSGQIIIVLVSEFLLYADDESLISLRKNLANGCLAKIYQTSYFTSLLHHERHSFKSNFCSKAIMVFDKSVENISLINVLEERMDESCYMLGDINCQSIIWNRIRFKDAMYCLLPSACMLDEVAKTYNVKLGDICDIKQGSILTRFVDGPPTADYEPETDGRLFYPVRGKDIEDMEICRDILPVRAKKGKNINHFFLKEGDILVTVKSSNIKAGIVSVGEDRNLLASSNCLIVKTKEGFSTDMVLAYLNSDCFKMYVNTNYINKYLKMLTVPFLQNAPISANIEDFRLTNKGSDGINIKKQRNSIKKYKKLLEKSQHEYEKSIDEVFNSKFIKLVG